MTFPGFLSASAGGRGKLTVWHPTRWPLIARLTSPQKRPSHRPSIPPAPAASLFAEATSTDPTGAPALRFDVEVAAGDYALLVCGCAPTYSDGERVSPPAANQALFAGVDGVTILADDGAPALLGGFAAAPGFTWQPLPASADGVPARLSIADTGTRSIDLWMADDGVLVQAVSLVPAAELDAGLAPLGQLCAGAE